jgi:hypothetical protein
VFAAVTCGVLFFFTRRPLRWPDWVQEDAAFLAIVCRVDGVKRSLA